MPDLPGNIALCLETRAFTADIIARTLAANAGRSEVHIRDVLMKALAANPKLHPSGWYDPPPFGAAVLLAKSHDPRRLQYPALREEEFWPRPDYRLTGETVGQVYLSPTHRASGIIGDFGFTFYRGKHRVIQQHLRLCLETLEEAAGYATVGMEFRELFSLTQTLLAQRGLNINRMVAQSDPAGINLGHTVPWTYEQPTPDEQAKINGEMTELKEIIRYKRRYLSGRETFTIPPTIALIFEARMENNTDPQLPPAYYQVILDFRDGVRTITSHLNPLFDALGMNYLRSNY